MLIILSPAKRLDFTKRSEYKFHSIPNNIEKAEEIMAHLKKMNTDELISLMKISPKLAAENYVRIQEWNADFNMDNAKQAVISFQGDAYLGLDAESFSEKDLQYSQDHLRILSGLHGVLRPADLVKPYRLEIGGKFSFGKYKSLYHYWKASITGQIREDIHNSGSNVLINLASDEYYKVINSNELDCRIIKPVFMEMKGDKPKVVSVYAKRARGLMTSFIIRNRIDDPELIKTFDSEMYSFSEPLSDENNWVFIR